MPAYFVLIVLLCVACSECVVMAAAYLQEASNKHNSSARNRHGLPPKHAPVTKNFFTTLTHKHGHQWNINATM
jgi:hypothetical protein